MRKLWIALVLACGIWQWRQLHSGPVVVPEGEGPPAPVAAPPPGVLGRLGLGAQPEAAPEPPTVPMVHCVIEGEGAFLRESACREQGGVVDEPSWARSEG